MSVPNELPDIGSTAQRLRQNPRFDPVVAGVGPEEYFVWTRFDGATTLKDLILMTGFDTPKAVDVVRRLRAMGAIILPNERPEQVTIGTAAKPAATRPAAAPRPASAPLRSRADSQFGDTAPTIERDPRHAAAPIDEAKPTTRTSATELLLGLDDTTRSKFRPTAAEVPAMAEDVDLPPAERERILVMHRRIPDGDRILGVADLADKKAIKRAYFVLSKEFHPDRFYTRKTGSFARRLEEIFEAVTRAYENLIDERNRRESAPPTAASPPGRQAATGGRMLALTASAPPNPVEYAAELFDRACQAEVSGDHAGALRLFAAAMRVEAPARYLRRAARCAVAANELAVALEYAKKAANLEPNDVSTARVLAHVFKVSGKLADAEEVLVLAMMIRSENDQLTHELQADLAEVRRLVARH